MPEIKAVIGLSWEPKLPTFSSAAKNGGGSGTKPRETNQLWKPNTQLVDGLFVPPNNPTKLNKLLKKQLKDTAGTSWYVIISTHSASFESWVFIRNPYEIHSQLNFLCLSVSPDNLCDVGLTCLHQP